MLVWHVMYVLITCMIGGHVVYVRVAWYACVTRGACVVHLVCLYEKWCTYGSLIRLEDTWCTCGWLGMLVGHVVHLWFNWYTCVKSGAHTGHLYAWRRRSARVGCLVCLLDTWCTCRLLLCVHVERTNNK